MMVCDCAARSVAQVSFSRSQLHWMSEVVFIGAI